MIGHYLTVAFRNIWRTPGATAINVSALALGLVCFIVAYAAVGYWAGADRHFANSDRTYVVTFTGSVNDGAVPMRVPETSRIVAEYLKVDFPEFAAVARLMPRDVDDMGEMMVAAGERKTILTSAYADPAFLEIFDLPFIAGGPVNALRQPNSVVLTETAATRLFGDQDPIGRRLVIDNITDASVTGVIGEIPQPSHLGGSAATDAQFDILASMDIREAYWSKTSGLPVEKMPEMWLGGVNYTTYFMLPEAGAISQAMIDTRLAEFAADRVPAEIRERFDLSAAAVPMTELMSDQLDYLLFSGVDAGISVTTILLILGGLVLLVACLNYANLATAVAASRTKEVGMRKALGAGRRQVVFQYLFEAGLLAAGALVIALAATQVIVPVLRNAAGIDLASTMYAGAEFWIFLLALVTGVSVLAGAYPAFVLSRVRPIDALRTGKGLGRRRLMTTLLVGTQFAAASFLLVTVIVMSAQNRELRQNVLDSGRDPVVAIHNMSALTGVENETLRSALERIPEVEAVSGNREQPWAMSVNTFGFASTPDPADGPSVDAYFERVDYDYFETLGVEILAGRVFDRERGADVPLDQPALSDPDVVPTMVVNRDFARQLGFASPEAAVGETVYMTGDGSRPAQPVRIIGVVEAEPSRLLGMGATSIVYFRTEALPFQLARISGDAVPDALTAIEETWNRLAPDVPLSLRFVDDLFAQNYALFQSINRVFVALALFAVAIAAIGLFGMAVHIAGRRTHEIGVRKTLGARTRQILIMLLRDFSRPVVVANLVAWPLAYLAGQVYLSIFVTRISLGPVPFVLSLAITLAIAWAAVAGQAYRAARIRPADVLRYE